jgi:hypothetical protein
MSAPNYEQLLRALQDVAEFARRVGAKKEGNSFQAMRARLQAAKRASEDLQHEIFKARGLAALPAFFSPDANKSERVS